MKRTIILAAAAAIATLACVTPSLGQNVQFVDGMQLHDQLEKFQHPEQYPNDSGVTGGLGGGYVAGVVDSQNGRAFCIPQGVKIGQFEFAVFRYLESHPEQWNHSGASLVVAALSEPWPCKKA